MLIDPDIRPHQTVYYTAGVVLRVLERLPSKRFDLATVYEEVHRVQEQVSLDAVVLSLDFLYLLDLVHLTETGELACS